MSNLLDFLVELANTPHYLSTAEIIQKQSTEIQHAFNTHNIALLKYQLSDKKNLHFVNERTVAQIEL